MLQKSTVEPGTLSLLKRLSKLEDLREFRLCGGTSLALQIGHRKSVDLDFFGPVETDFDILLASLNKEFDVEVNYRNRTVLSCFINEVKVDVVQYQYPWIAPPVIEEGITLCSVQDIGAMKLEAIKGRGKKRDFFDLYYLLQQFPLSEIFRFNLLKYNNKDTTLILRSLTFFGDADADIDINGFYPISWSEMKDFISDHVKQFIQAL